MTNGLVLAGHDAITSRCASSFAMIALVRSSSKDVRIVSMEERSVWERMTKRRSLESTSEKKLINFVRNELDRSASLL